MKIGFIGHKYVPSREGGVEIVVDRLSTIDVAKNIKKSIHIKGVKLKIFLPLIKKP